MKQDFLAGGAVLSAMASVLPAVCCLGPLVATIFSFFGVSSIVLGAALEPYQSYFSAGALIFLGFSFYFTYWPHKTTCDPEQACANPKGEKLQRYVLWLVTLLTLGTIAFPYLLPHLPYSLFL